jgi:hypothetical protein
MKFIFIEESQIKNSFKYVPFLFEVHIYIIFFRTWLTITLEGHQNLWGVEVAHVPEKVGKYCLSPSVSIQTIIERLLGILTREYGGWRATPAVYLIRTLRIWMHVA